mmetsp:Transcript_15215/g.45749  ORF Transcript_15215/g.45749 Transcript_15215/m.45749 type:complete len:222 (+) Transcript_15215:407-1072(+)
MAHIPCGSVSEQIPQNLLRLRRRRRLIGSPRAGAVGLRRPEHVVAQMLLPSDAHEQRLRLLPRRVGLHRVAWREPQLPARCHEQIPRFVFRIRVRVVSLFLPIVRPRVGLGKANLERRDAGAQVVVLGTHRSPELQVLRHREVLAVAPQRHPAFSRESTQRRCCVLEGLLPAPHHEGGDKVLALRVRRRRAIALRHRATAAKHRCTAAKHRRAATKHRCAA